MTLDPLSSLLLICALVAACIGLGAATQQFVDKDKTQYHVRTRK